MCSQDCEDEYSILCCDSVVILQTTEARLTVILMLNNGIDGLEQRLQKQVIAVVSKDEYWRCHCCKELHQFRRGLRAEVNNMRCDVVDYGEQSRKYSVDLSFARRNECIDRLLRR